MDLFDSTKTKNLCIIGNGFDMHHGLETGYSSFYEYLTRNGKGDFASQLESFFQTEYVDENGHHRFLLWSDLEKAIGAYDLDHIFHESTDWIEIDYDHMMQTSAQIEDSPDTFLAPLLEGLPSEMEKWIGSVGLKGVDADVVFPVPSIFLSFNYTRTIEEVYHVPEHKVLHIHGVVGGSSDLIVGHKGRCDEHDALDEAVPIYEENSKMNIIRIMQVNRKPTEEIITRNAPFFQSLHDISDVYVYGHSYSMVDKDYFEEIRKSIGEEAQWHLGCHDEKDRNAAEILMETIGVPKGYWRRFEF